MIDDLLLTPAMAFLIYLGATSLLSRVGHFAAVKRPYDPLQSSTYAGGEHPSKDGALPDYSSSFVIALFFGVVHVGVLMVGSDTGSPLAAIYLIGLSITLAAFILG